LNGRISPWNKTEQDRSKDVAVLNFENRAFRDWSRTPESETYLKEHNMNSEITIREERGTAEEHADLQDVSDAPVAIRPVTIEDYDDIFALWNSTEQSRRALNPVDDSREGIERYLKRNPTTCFLAAVYDDAGERKTVGVILTGHDGRRGIIHHMCVHPDYRRKGIARMLVQKAEEALRGEGITKVFGLVFKNNEAGNAFWEEQGYSLRTNLNYRNKSLNENVPRGE